MQGPKTVASQLQGKSIILFGAGGIGDELARRYAREGASVLVGDIDGNVSRKVADEIVSAGGTAIGLEVDGTQEASIAEAVRHACQAFGGLDGMHANFTRLTMRDQVDDVLSLSMEEYDAGMQTDARGYLLCTRHALPAIIERGGGSILYTSSDAVYLGEPVRLPYAMGKSAIHALMRHVSGRFGDRGVRANAIAPGLIVHAKIEAAGSEIFEHAKANNRLKTRLGAPTDIAALAALLMSDEGGYITGQVLNVNGGVSVRP